MPGIDPQLITHTLNVNPLRKQIKQNKRIFAPERQEAIKQDVEKLLEAGFIEKIQISEWLENSKMIKKENGKWRMCVVFTDLNDACLKDCYPLPRIDTLIYATNGHEMLNVRSRKYCRGGGFEYNTTINYKILSNLMRIFN